MLSSTQLRALKKNSREINRVPDESTKDFSGTAILNKSEIESLVVTKQDVRSLLSQSDFVDPVVRDASFSHNLIRYSVHTALLHNGGLFQPNNVVVRHVMRWASNLARAMVPTTLIAAPGIKPLAHVDAGIQAMPFTGRLASLIITYQNRLHDGGLQPDEVYVHYQTTLTSPTAGSQMYIAQYCTIPVASWDPTLIRITSVGPTRGYSDMQLALQSIPVADRGEPGALFVDIPNIDIITSSTQTSVPVTTIPPATKLMFSAFLKHSEEYPHLNILLTTSYRHSDYA
ncbi:VP10 [Banna-like virus strain Balaton/2010/HUN]|nr:VP10 [Banna-like virus strain Balaton/2010/HUN]